MKCAVPRWAQNRFTQFSDGVTAPHSSFNTALQRFPLFTKDIVFISENRPSFPQTHPSPECDHCGQFDVCLSISFCVFTDTQTTHTHTQMCT